MRATSFWKRVERPSPYACWEWIGPLKNNGYGHVVVRRNGAGVTTTAHRRAWELTYGPIPEGLQVDHLCHNKPCCNPVHLQLLTPEANRRRVWRRGSRGYLERQGEAWRLVLELPRDGDGRRRRHTQKFPTREDAERALAELRAAS